MLDAEYRKLIPEKTKGMLVSVAGLSRIMYQVSCNEY
jgi:hypothetical protein